MKHTSLFMALAFVAGLGIGSINRTAYTSALPPKDSHAADLAAIENLHQEDVAATISMDPKRLIDIWTEDGVRLEPGRPALVGKQAIQADNAKGRAEHPDFKVLSYAPEIKGVQIADGWAFEWDNFEARVQTPPEGRPPLVLRAKALRVLQRQNDGSWKFARICWNESEPQQ